MTKVDRYQFRGSILNGGTRATVNEYPRSSLDRRSFINFTIRRIQTDPERARRRGKGDRIINHTSDRLTIHFSHMLIAVY